MTAEASERFIAAQIAGLAALGLGPAALAREESLLRAGFAQAALLAALCDFPPSPGGRGHAADAAWGRGNP